MEEFEFHTSISGKVRNTKLPKTHALLPLYEAISNSIHAIEERGNSKDGRIEINIIRQGSLQMLNQVPDIDIYPALTFEVKDNGIGFNDDNYYSFLTAESEYKIEKGAKGIGRFVCLKAFTNVIVDSNYKVGEQYYKRKFLFKSSGKGIFNYENPKIEASSQGTTVTLFKYHPEYIEHCPKKLEDIAEKIIEHFLIYFLLDKCPLIILKETNGNELILQDSFNSYIKPSIKQLQFDVKKESFTLHILRLFTKKVSHQIHYSANEREVLAESLHKLMPDLGKSIEDENGEHFVYQVIITGDYLDKNVNPERTSFSFPKDVEEDQHYPEPTLLGIRERAVGKIENLLEKFLANVIEEKFSNYQNHIVDSSPQFRPLLKYKPDSIKTLKPNLNGNKLNIELFKIQSDLEVEVQELGENILNGKKDITETDDYKKKYDDYIEKFNDIGKSNLAKYIVHRKAVIELLDKFLGLIDDNFVTEDTIHSIFFPIKSESDEISYDKQNLWLIDERLAYHSYLASDKSFQSIPITDSASKDRPDLLIFNDSFAFVNDEAPHNSFVIVEFKRPERDDYQSDNPKKNPVDQVISYIRSIRENKAKDRKNKLISVDKDRTPFYAYIICDLSNKLNSVLEERDFKKTPDGQGYFKFHDSYNAYIELISYQKLLKDAKMRNRILFEKLGIPY